MRLCPQCSGICDSAHKFCATCGFPISKIADPATDPVIGRTLPGGYCILELVGIGGMGRVYRAEQTALGRTVAVKIIHPHLVGEESAAARFITEARAASRLNHPNSVSIIDFGKTDDSQLYLVMEFLRGRDLSRVAFDEGPLPLRRIVNVMDQTLAALAEAHHLEIIHRDLKPENIILEPVRGGGDFVKVVDFGLAKMRLEKSQPSITSPGIVCGTPEYMSPEQGRGDILDPRSDLYALGVILYQLLTGKLPFDGDSPTQIVLAHITNTPQDPRVVAPHRAIPEALTEVILRALAKDPGARFRDADAFRYALRTSLGDEERDSVRSSRLIKCSSCGTTNTAGQKFCGECGGPLSTIAPTMPPPLSYGGHGGRPYVPDGPRQARVPAPRNLQKLPLPLVGRDDDLAWLDQRRSEARAQMEAVLIAAEAGVGKTRLLDEFLTVCAAAGDTVVRSGPDPYSASVGYFTVTDLVRKLSGLHEELASPPGDLDANVRAGLAQLFTSNRIRMSQLDVSPEDRRHWVTCALRWAIERSHERHGSKRLVLAVDDLHMVDAASRNALRDLANAAPSLPGLLVGAHTTGFDAGWSACTARTLAGLSPATVAELFSSGKPNLSRTDDGGVIPALYVDQLVRYSQEQGGAAPNRLADLLALRVERLEASARRTLQAVAIWGDAATESILVRLIPDEANIDRSIAHLARSGMVEADGRFVKTSHPLLRNIVLATIPATVKKDLHSAAAEVAQEVGVPLEALAVHEYEAGHAFQALILLERVSSEAEGRDAIDDSILALRRCLDLARKELFRGELDDPLRAVLIFSRKLGEALARSGAYADAEGVLREAVDLAAHESADRAHLLGSLARVARGRDHIQDARSYLSEALDLAARSGMFDLVTSLEPLRRALHP
jgi:serine/threonine-protein kinase